MIAKDSTSDVSIRPYREGDSRALFEAATESIAEVFRWLPWCHPGYTLEESDAWVAHSIEAWSRRTELNFVIEDGSGRFLGGTGLNQIAQNDRVANLGYWVRSSATRRGVATAAVRQTAAHAFRHTDVVRLEVIVAVGNAASLRVAEKVGALREGVLRDRVFSGGASHDAVMHALLRSRLSPPPLRA
ncbi:MAG: GNAT family N-acetyltransferase [Candidatus Binatia bacterium]